MKYIFYDDLGIPPVTHVSMEPVKDSIFFERGPLDEFMSTVVGVDENGNDIVSCSRDVSILLNQKRINSSCLSDAVNALLSTARNGSLRDQFENLSDDELLSCIKSRYIQAPCELVEWSQFLEGVLSDMDVSASSSSSDSSSDSSSSLAE